MPHHRLFLRGSNGHFARPIDLDVADDDEAVRVAPDLDHPYPVEIWQGARHVVTIEPDTG